ncbi:MAG: DUF1659 domain-containing protein [Acidaminococcaceae bacterium]|nr:DUF1659 domain-containing protein [Acidaminococcaceae bacterium]
MSINITLVSKKLQLMLNNGVSDSGSARTITKSVAHINPEATDEELMSTAEALGTLFANSTVSIYHVEKNLLEKSESDD